MSPKARFFVKSSEDMGELGDGEVDLIVTSPPEWDITYVREEGYQVDMPFFVLSEIQRVLKPGGFLVYNMGNKMLDPTDNQDIDMQMYFKIAYPSISAWTLYKHTDFILVADIIGYFEGEASKIEPYPDVAANQFGNRYEHWFIFAKDTWRLRRGGLPNLVQMGTPSSFTDTATLEKLIMFLSEKGDLVLDPFAGTGTVGMVALALGRRAVLYDVDPEMIPPVKERIPNVVIYE